MKAGSSLIFVPLCLRREHETASRTGATGGIIQCTPAGPNDDVDKDGFTPNQGDCNDCDPNVNPNAVEVVTEGNEKAYDENCDGQTDELGYSASREFKCGHSDIHATVQHLLGIDYQKNTFPFEGRDESLVGVTPARILTELFT